MSDTQNAQEKKINQEKGEQYLEYLAPESIKKMKDALKELQALARLTKSNLEMKEEKEENRE